MDTEDPPCTGEPPKPAVVYLTTPAGLFVRAALVVDFYAVLPPSP